jgi:hypothetical protein
MYPSATTKFPCIALIDSGAYQDETERVTFQQALDRQQAYEKKLGYNAKYIVAYDKIGDREETVKANRFLLESKLPDGQQKVLMIQGDIDEEYSRCLSGVLGLSKTHSFVLGFGGISRAGANNLLKERLYCAVIDNFSEFGNVKHIHLFGVLNAEINEFFESLFPHTLLSVDTAGIEIRSVMGYVFKDGRYQKTYTKEQKFKEYHPNTLAQDNVRRVLNYYNTPEYYKYMQLCEGV